ncbi:MAG: DNA mismatch repair endonuclease MutL [Polyangiales bacterium]
MAASIRILPDTLADQIAAGEVVERPASVVKELIENAIDAGALRVSVEIEDGGLRAIRVIDDGSGMSREDALLCVQRHATSKLRSREDLFNIRTLGFRGEALPSIASVSRFRLATRTRDEDGGVELRLEGGASQGSNEVGCAPGTRIEVEDLFYNVPARLKFLKSKPTESGHVSNTCLRAALAHPRLALTLARDGRQTHAFLPGQNLFERARSAFPDEPLTTYELPCDGVTLQAALGAPERARSGAAHLHLFVNQRPVRDLTLARCIAFAYGSVLPPGRFPVGVVHLEVDPTEVDVNVHPQKLEVRFARGRALLDAITRTLAHRLGTSAFRGPAARGPGFWEDRLRAAGPTTGNTAPDAGSDAADPWGLHDLASLQPRATSESQPPSPPSQPDDERWRHATHVSERAPAQGFTTAPAASLLETPGYFSRLRLLGQARRTFLVCEGDQGILIIDQHAADERVRFDQLRRSYAERTVRVQRLLFPERVECTEVEAGLIEQHGDELGQVGLECSRLGPSTVAVAAVPALLSRAAPARLLRDLLSELTRSGERAFQDAIDMALATMACHAAIRAGDVLSDAEGIQLLRQLDAVQDFQRHCPHGRPILCNLPFTELEQRLGR